ncbi:hypothetical protein QR680_001329 [Steinernema hermaphroditum]|uniref:Uncharacterized protein n=1 Tax=Steinernema hermaphroditum TaxID=289476 RepID=A0AA39LFS9_9BILA|nr:hypothetical protein QR680_001329 [Steinernema hermaphroditum]
MEKPLRVKPSKTRQRNLSPPPVPPTLRDLLPEETLRPSLPTPQTDSQTDRTSESERNDGTTEHVQIEDDTNFVSKEASPEASDPPIIPEVSPNIPHNEAKARLLAVVTPNTPEHSEKAKEKPSIAPRSIYPKVNDRHMDASLVAHVAESSPSVIYPRLRGDHFLEVNENGLLSEAALCAFYPNERYEMVDDYVENFAKMNLESRNSLWLLLKRYNECCSRADQVTDEKSEIERNIGRVFNESWSVEERTVTQSGRCGDNKSASGSSSYKVATLRPEKVAELNRLMSEHCSKELDENLCWQIHSRSLALQIQWKVVNLGSVFLDEHKVIASNPPSILMSDHVLDSRSCIRGALSDLFYFLRLHHITIKFRECVIGWIVELTSYLMKCATSEDQMFLLCHVLHSPSPTDSWAPQLVQTFITHPALDMKSTIDDFIALLSLLLSPIRHRERFLENIKKHESDDNSWAVIGEDGETEISSFVTINEQDLIALLNQFGIQDFYKKAVMHFTAANNHNALDTLLSLVALQLLLLKIFNEGLKTYNVERYKSFCRHIAQAMRQSVKDFCVFWNLTQPQLSRQQCEIVQKEVDRIVVIATYYIVSKETIGMWQYLVSIPYEVLSETCRLKCELLMRNSTSYSPQDLFAMSQSDVENALAKGSKLIDKISDGNNTDSTFMLSALTDVVSSGDKEPESFLRDIVHVCFLDESTRQHFYKVGAEAVGLLIQRKPSLLSFLLKLIDRNADNLDNYAADILTTAPLSKCKLTKDDVGSIFGKWLINRKVEHPVSRIARRVLTSVNWGPINHRGDLWIDQDVHVACAEAIVKGHIAQFKNQNGLIAKSMKNAMKMWSKIPDMGQQFNTFCFDVLIRLKLPLSQSSRTPSADITDYYVYLVQYCLSSVDNFVDHGISYFQQLLNTGCFNAATAVLSKFVAQFPEGTERLCSIDAFRETFEMLMTSDASSYALQLLVGADQFPGPVAKCFSSAITHSVITNSRKFEIAFGWLRLLCMKRPTAWNQDNTSLYLIGKLVDIVVAEDDLNHHHDLLSKFVDFIANFYKESLKIQTNTGFLSFIMSSNVPPPLIERDQMKISPSAAYVLLKAEYHSYAPFYERLYQSLGKNSQHTVEHAVKKAHSKTNIDLAPNRLYYSRLLELCCVEETYDSIIFTLLLQELAVTMFSRKDFEGKKFCPGDRFLSCKTTNSQFIKFRDEVFPAMRTKLPGKSERLCRSVLQWIFANGVYSMNFFNFQSLQDDYLLQLVFANDFNIWTDFISKENAKKNIATDRKLYANSCHMDIMPKVQAPARDNAIISIDEFMAYLAKNPFVGEDFPSIPQHPNLPSKNTFDEVSFSNTNLVLSRFGAKLSELLKAIAVFSDAKGRISDLDVTYGNSISGLYKQSQTTLKITLKCGDVLFNQRSCTKPSEVEVIVSASHFSPAVDAKMGANRQQRIVEISSAFAQLLDSMAVVCANIESLADSLCEVSSAVRLQLREQELQQTGRSLFCYVCSTITASHMLCLAATKSFEAIINCLGKTFMANVPQEQATLMNVVLSGNVLNYVIVENFTPDIVPSSQLFAIYKQLSVAVRCPEKSQSAKSLLSRLDIAKAGSSLPAEQYSQLLPVIFENIASVGDHDEELLQLCMDHFLHTMFHKFPHNLSAGLEMMLAGCNTKHTPKMLFSMVMAQIGCGLGTTMKSTGNVKHQIPPEMVDYYIELIGKQLKSSRRELGPRLFQVWADYLELVCRLAAYFIIVHVENTFHFERPPTAMEIDLRECFNKCIQIWGPLMEPMGPGIPPFNPADRSIAQQVTDRLVSLLLWLPHNKRLPKGAENVETLFFQYLCENLASLKGSGASHVYSVYALEFVKFNWQMFWPTLLDIGQMEKLFCDPEFSEIHPLLTEIFVRLPWHEIQRHQLNQPYDALAGFYSLLFSIITRAISNESNYVRCRASMPRLLTSLTNSPWYVVSQPFADKTSAFIAESFKPELFFNPNEISKPFFSIWRIVSWSSTVEPSNVLIKVSRAEKAKKQSLFVRTHLLLLLRSNFDRAEMMNKYRETIKNTNAIISCYPGQIAECQCLSYELTAFWSRISKDSTVEEYRKVLAKWLSVHHESQLVLLVLKTTLSSLQGKHIFVGLKLLDEAISVYFTRNTTVEWTVICEWLELPPVSHQWLFTTPSSESGVVPLCLVLNGLLMKELSHCKSPNEESRILKKVSGYIASIKPKYITSDAALLTVVEKWMTMIVRQYSIGTPVATANEQLNSLLAWLHKVYSEEKSAGLLSRLARIGRSAPFSQKIQLIAEVFELFITQQTTAPGRAPRMAGDVPVTNSKIEAIKSIASAKSNAEFQKVFTGNAGTNVISFFTDVHLHHLGTLMEFFAALVKPLYPDEKIIRLL